MSLKNGFKTYSHWLAYGVIALVIMLPMLTPGFILLIDMVFVPHPPLPDSISHDFLFRAALYLLSFVIPADVLQKILLFTILIMSGAGGYRLSRHVLANTSSLSRWAAYSAGIFYMVNPFTYGRFMAGQYAVLLGYVLLPFFAHALLKLWSHPSRRTLLISVGWVLAISIVSLHTFGAAIILSIVMIITILCQDHSRQTVRRVAVYAGAGAGLVALFSSYWLIPAFIGKGALSDATAQFGTTDIQAFATDGGLLNVLQLKGFWLEAQGLFMPAGDPLPFTGVWQVLLWGIIICGGIAVWKQHQKRAIFLCLTAFTAIVLTVASPLSQWFATQFIGFREPHKLVMLLTLVYTVCIAFGAKVILERFKKSRLAVLITVLILPILTTPAMLWGFWGQLQPTDYPKEWYSLNRTLSQDAKVLFLPWHMYMKFSFTNQIIANPADAFFDAKVITSRDPEFADTHAPYGDEQTRKLNAVILRQAPSTTQLGALLTELGITHVLLVKEGRWQEYMYMDKQTDIRLVQETDAFKLYRIEEKKP